MPTSERRRGARGILPLVLVAAVATAVLAFASNGGSGLGRRRGSRPRSGAASSAARGRTVDVGQRVLVVLNAPSLAQRVAVAGGLATETAGAGMDDRGLRRAAPAALRARAHGLRLTVEYSYARVLNGFSAAARPARDRRSSSARARWPASTRSASRIPPRSRRRCSCRARGCRHRPSRRTSRCPASTAAA